MKIPQRGTAAADLFDQLEAYRANDLQWRGGRAFAYVYHAGAEAEAVAKEAYSRYLSVNGLDFTVFPSVRRLETEVAAMCASHLSAGPEAVGSFTSGGTESIMLAVKAARGAAKAKGGVPGTPEVILPVTAHAAFHKAAHYLGMKCVSIPVERATMQVNVADVAAAINENTVMLVGSATSYGPGVVDPIAELGELAQRHALWLHVDGCIGGFMIPYFRRLGAAIPDFDFRIPGVSSISMDLHKYGFAPKGASVVMYRTAEHRRHQMFAFSGWTGYTIVNHTVQSSKSGGPLAAAWAVMRFLGDEGYLAIAEKLWEATNAICDGIEAMDGIELLVRPQMCLIAACSTSVNIFHVIDEMNSRGWYVQPQLSFGGYPACMHLTVMSGTQVAIVDEFLGDLKTSIAAAKALPDASPAPSLVQLLQSLDPATLNSQTIAQLLGMAGIRGTDLPKRMAEINGLIDAMPPRLSEAILADFVNQMFVCPSEV